MKAQCDRIAKCVDTKAIKPFVSKDLDDVIKNPNDECKGKGGDPIAESYSTSVPINVVCSAHNAVVLGPLSPPKTAMQEAFDQYLAMFDHV